MLVLVGSLVAGLLAICIVFAASGVDPFYALYRIFCGLLRQRLTASVRR